MIKIQTKRNDEDEMLIEVENYEAEDTSLFELATVIMLCVKSIRAYTGMSEKKVFKMLREASKYGSWSKMEEEE